MKLNKVIVFVLCLNQPAYQAEGALYHYDHVASGTQTATYLDTTYSTTSSSPWNVLGHPSTSRNLLGDPRGQSRNYNIEWLDAGIILDIPGKCVINESWGAIFELALLNSGPYVLRDFVYSNTEKLYYHKEPVNIVASSTVGWFGPPVLKCDSVTDQTIEVGWTSYHNAQKWWDGGTPNYRTVKTSGVLMYNRKASFVNIQLHPTVITLKGAAGTLLETEVTASIQSDGPVRLSAPAVTGVQYENLSNWKDDLSVSISDVSEQGKNVLVRLRVSGGKPGDNSYQIPFTVNVI
ncbi:hypothetical protein FK765_25630 [Escherichia coli]|nr:hypothetical protein [Escherichia coli]